MVARCMVDAKAKEVYLGLSEMHCLEEYRCQGGIFQKKASVLREVRIRQLRA